MKSLLQRHNEIFLHTGHCCHRTDDTIHDPVTRNGLDIEQLRQGSFFTWKGKRLVPGTTSYATPRELLRWLIKLEQAKLVDAFSSREIKRLLYMVVVMSNVLRKNSAVVHQTLATRLHRMLEADHGVGKFSSNAPQADK